MYSTLTGPTDGVDRVELSVWIFMRANTVLNFEKHNQLQNEGLNLVLNLVLVLVSDYHIASLHRTSSIIIATYITYGSSNLSTLFPKGYIRYGTALLFSTR